MKDILKLALTLMVFATVACVGLAFVYAGTEAQIRANQTAQLNIALKAVFGENSEFEEITNIPGSGDSAVAFTSAYRARKGNTVAGIALIAQDNGFSDVIQALVGIGSDGEITGVRILKDTDTPGLGANAASPGYFVDKPANQKTFYGQFTGMAADGGIKVTKDGGAVEAITAATITSRAVSLLVNVAGETGRKWLEAEGALK
ncbi:RnfABCDGE type electron transport complex subunit G [Leadbettera azotonutricia]|uniref:Ion-translocating oxidoreductase complex subunit G n=1 Tax=Leadbettera azotonutricia (strain ATCC BAA-888 / DSM 13862 / ZAS-9) TaxID=545695 RepID=F5YEF0_LEAAZ|nr:RnfABCDGE type electron transport complex subunit G [Leadbettera azotonutricia]AEF81852.1 electron transport complex, rnfabcdGe type, g subunit [Leadbettera azotonutricia ZAS-9]